MRIELRKSITALVFVLFSGFGEALLAQPPIELKADAPERYVVVPGDTLWSISQRYLTAPQRWPDLWNMNKDTIGNPHRIYPGNVLVLDRAKGRLEVVSDTVKLSPKTRIEQTTVQEIPSIPPNLIEPYLSRPLVVEPDGLDRAPTIVATQENRVILGAGNVAYVSGLGPDNKEEIWNIYRRGKALVDPESSRTVAYEATFLGSARIKQGGEPATIEIVSAVQEIGKGDKLVAAGRPQVPSYAPHAPSGQIRGQVMAIYGGVSTVGEAGRNSVVTLNRGRADGLEIGHVLALMRLGAPVNEVRSTMGYTERKTAAGMTRVPDERYGLVFVFRVFDRISYALVMDVSRPVIPLDVVQTP